MKINVEFDLTPEEFRRALGLPDVEAFQQELLNRIQKQMESGVEGYDPMSLMKPFLQQGFTQDMSQGLSQGLASFGTYQQMMLDMLRQAGSSMGKAAQEPAAEAEPKRAEKSAGKTGAAEARSRSRRSE
ncbi:hypothetical protein HOP61_09315 [Halomonas daqingensis]|uniref:Uncharacterized protein n=1 Tax=Billgrantia desiderata TaxID=52021 RepID=A0AAW4YRF3_9GAMM|nr:DUF6489 family protein [Halomonas desiderata]MCE8051489.1 hypothetical protein [Halomonas desiderata]SEF64890.1 hypothetical protein SAMN04487953_103221 [Halomonas desiderata]